MGDVSISLCNKSEKHLWEQNIPKSCISQVVQSHLKEQKKRSQSCLFCTMNRLSPCQVGSDEYGEILIYRRLGRDSPWLGCGRRQRCDGTICREMGWPAWSFALLNHHCCARERWGLSSSLLCRYRDPGWPQASGYLTLITVFLPFCQVSWDVLGAGGAALLQTCPTHRTRRSSCHSSERFGAGVTRALPGLGEVPAERGESPAGSGGCGDSLCPQPLRQHRTGVAHVCAHAPCLAKPRPKPNTKPPQLEAGSVFPRGRRAAAAAAPVTCPRLRGQRRGTNSKGSAALSARLLRREVRRWDEDQPTAA